MSKEIKTKTFISRTALDQEAKFEVDFHLDLETFTYKVDNINVFFKRIDSVDEFDSPFFNAGAYLSSTYRDRIYVELLEGLA